MYVIVYNLDNEIPIVTLLLSYADDITLYIKKRLNIF